MPIIIWQDLRSAEMIPEIKKMLEEGGMSAEELYDRCGMTLGSVNPQSNLQWIKKYQPEAYENATTIHTMMGLLTKAFGADDYYDDYTDTPWLQLNGPDFQYDPNYVRCWAWTSINWLRFANHWKLSAASAKKWRNTQDWQKAHRSSWEPATSSAAAWVADVSKKVLAMPVAEQQVSWRINPSKPLRDPSRKCYVLGTPDGNWVMEGVANASGSAFKWFKEEFCNVENYTAKGLSESVYDMLCKMAERNSKAGANGIFYLPYLGGAASPNLNANARGTYVGVSVGHTRIDFIRAMMEGICFDIKDMLEAIKEGGAAPFDTVRLTGGMFRSEEWCQMQCDIFNCKCEVVAVEEATSLGCAMMATVGAGIYKDLPEAAKHMVKIKKVYTPNPKNVEIYENAFKVWRQVYKDLANKAFDMIAEFQETYRD